MFNKRTIAIAAAIAFSILSLSACSSSSSEPNPPADNFYSEPPVPEIPATTPEEDFITTLRSFDNYIIAVTDDYELIKLGNQTCSILDMGYTIQDIMNELVYNSSLSTEEDFEFAGLIVGAGVRHFCPEYITEVEAFLS